MFKTNVQNAAEMTDENIVDYVDGEAAVTHTVQKVATRLIIKKMKKNDPNEEQLQKAFSILEASASGEERRNRVPNFWKFNQ